MLKILKLAQKDIKRTKVKKDYKTQEKPEVEPRNPCVADRYAAHYTMKTIGEEKQNSIDLIK